MSGSESAKLALSMDCAAALLESLFIKFRGIYLVVKLNNPVG